MSTQYVYVCVCVCGQGWDTNGTPHPGYAHDKRKDIYFKIYYKHAHIVDWKELYLILNTGLRVFKR